MLQGHNGAETPSGEQIKLRIGIPFGEGGGCGEEGKGGGGGQCPYKPTLLLWTTE